MTRTAARELAVRLGFSLSFETAPASELLDEFFAEEHFETLKGEDEIFSSMPDEEQMRYIRDTVEGVEEHRHELDGYIEEYSLGWRLERISRAAASVLRVAMYEILYVDDVPTAAAINEAVELAKRYEEPETVAFINGILGSFVRGMQGGESTGTAEAEGAEE